VVQAAAIEVIVSDIPTAVGFYRRLGLEFPEPIDPQGHGHTKASLGGGMRLMLDSEASIRSVDPGWTQPTGGHRLALAFDCGSPDAVDELYRELVSAGAEPHNEPWDAFWGQRYAQVRDPDGNVVDLFASLPRA
jgi:uncharacterized glyoxalase superfamily protein PhnB